MKKFSEKQTGILALSDLRTAKGKLIYWMFFSILVMVALISVIPAVWTILTALKDTQEIYSSFSFFPKDMSLGKIISRISESWKALQLGDSIINTIVMSIGQVIMRIVVCGFGGYALSKIKPSGTKLIFILVTWTMMMPSQIRMVPNYISWIHFPWIIETEFSFNLLDTFWPMWFLSGADSFAVLLFKNAFDGLSSAYVDAAKIDGCGNIGVFFRIMLPLAMPLVIFEAISVLSAAWSSFLIPLLVLDELMIVPVRIYKLQEDINIMMNTYFMALVFASVPPFLIFAVFQKRILGGVNIGGVKG